MQADIEIQSAAKLPTRPFAPRRRDRREVGVEQFTLASISSPISERCRRMESSDYASRRSCVRNESARAARNWPWPSFADEFAVAHRDFAADGDDARRGLRSCQPSNAL